MATKKMMPLATCDLHKDEKAAAMCLKSHELLCVSCIVTKAKEEDCNIQDIRDERVQCVLEHLFAKQIVTQFIENISNQLTKTQNLKEKLLHDIGNLHKELSSRLDEMARDCEEFITKNASQNEEEILRENTIFDDYNAKLKRNLEKLKEDENFNQCAFELTAIKEDLESQSNERMSDPEGCFIPNEGLRQILKKERLGLSQLYNQKLYDIVGDLDDHDDAMAVPMGQKPLAENETCCGSDEVIIRTPQNSTTKQAEVTKKPKENRSILDKLRNRLTSRAGNVASEVYDEIPRPTSFKLTNVINTKVKIPDLESSIFPSAPK